MTRLLATIMVLALMLVACGGSAAPVVTATPVAVVTTPAPTPTPTTKPTATPAPTPAGELIRVTSDADVDKLFVGLSASEVAKAFEASTKENYKVPLMFDPHGAQFTLSYLSVKPTGSPEYQIFVVKLTSGTVTIKSYSPNYLLAAQRNVGSEKHWWIEPQDETKPVPGQPGAFPLGGKGFYVEMRQEAGEPTFDPNNLQASFFREVGKPMFKLSATAPTMAVWPGNGHLVIRGDGFGFNNASTLTQDSLLRQDGKIVYIK